MYNLWQNAGLIANRLANGNGHLCKNCLKAAGGLGSWMQLRTMSLGEIRERVGASSPEAAAAIDNHNATLGFVISKSVGDYIQVDETNKKVKFPHITMQNALNNMVQRINIGVKETDYSTSLQALEEELKLNRAQNRSGRKEVSGAIGTDKFL